MSAPKGTIYNWISQRKLPFIKIGRRVKFDKKDIDKFIDERKVCQHKDYI